MDLSMKWLNDYVKADMPIKEFCDGMTIHGASMCGIDKNSEKYGVNVVTVPN